MSAARSVSKPEADTETFKREGKMIWVIKAKDDFEFGYRAGRRRERLLRAALRSAAAALKGGGADEGATLDRARRHAAVLEASYPACLERYAGLSRALGLDLHEVIAGGLAMPYLFRTACTNFVAVPPATVGDRIFVSWNFDLVSFFKLLLGRMPLYIRDVQGCKPYVCIGIPVLFGLGIMNGDGLSAAANAVGAMDAGEGLTYFELNNLAMETQSTVDGVVGVWRDNPREIVPGMAATILLNGNNLFADMSGDAALIEYSHHHLSVEKAAGHNGVLASANHHQFLDRKLSGGVDPSMEPIIAGSFARLGRMWELLETFHGRIDPRVAKIIVSDHGLNYSSLEEFGMARSEYEERVDDATICCHYWNFFHHLKRLELENALIEYFAGCTLYSMLMDPKRCTIWFISGKPCRKQYMPVWLGDALRMEWSEQAKGELEYKPGTTLKSYSQRKDVLRRPNPTPASERFRSLGISFFKSLEKVMAASVAQGEAEGTSPSREEKAQAETISKAG
jgi:hypothetical protein